MAAGKTLVFGGRGMVGAAICRELARRSVGPVISLARSKPATTMTQGVEELGGIDALEPETFESLLPGARAVVISIGEPPWILDKERAMRSNGLTNISILRAAAKHQVPRIVLVNATMPSWGLIAGYREGKQAAEKEAQGYADSCGTSCSVLVMKPSAVSGTRQEGSLKIPLWIVLEPMRAFMNIFSRPLQALENLIPSLLGNVLKPPVRVEELALAAADAIEAPAEGGFRELGVNELVGYTVKKA